jgi:hypothetical protein
MRFLSRKQNRWRTVQLMFEARINEVAKLHTHNVHVAFSVLDLGT